MTDNTSDKQLLDLTAQIVAAHVGNNSTQNDALPGLIRSVYDSLAGIGAEPAKPARPEPAVPIRKSVFDDYIVCLEDGKKLKMLKRHLMTAYNLTPHAYRERWGLAPDYPMVAPTYAKHRSTLAKRIGLGRKPAAAKVEVVAKKVPAKRGRKKAS